MSIDDEIYVSSGDGSDLADGSDYGDDGGFDEEDHYDGDHFTTTGILGESLLDADITLATAMLADTDITIVRTGSGADIFLPLSELTSLARAAYSLLLPDAIKVSLDASHGYRRTSPLPVVRVSQGDPNDGGLVTSSQRAAKGFPIGLKLTQVAVNYLAARWQQPREETLLSDLCTLLADRLLNAGNSCVMCDSVLPFPGVKPTICNEPLCQFQLETLGLGADITLFDSDYKVADLLITAACAAFKDIVRLAKCKTVMPQTKSDEPYTATALHALLDALPDHEVLKDAGPARHMLLSDAHKEAPFILGWIFATNRAHIVSLPETERIPEMKTAHQFKIHTSTRAHAERFDALKRAHGSFFVFHGSPLSNWHSILRENLRNASHTPMMSSGAAFGEGIYMARSTATSAAYSRASAGWSGSAFGRTATCIALVEVANSPRVHHHSHGQIIVASDESCVMLRYLFVYSDMAIPSIDAKNLKIADKMFKNETTIAYGASYAEVVASGNLLVTSDEYFWDIEEVVGMIQAKNGLFINGYTQLPFAPKDIQAILNHKTGAGKMLLEVERENAALKKDIPSSVLQHLRGVGRTCVLDNSADFGTAHDAIAKLRDWVPGLPQTVRTALERVPFSATDSHTRIPFRDTIAHAIELVTSGGECVHRFGDFLSQVQ